MLSKSGLILLACIIGYGSTQTYTKLTYTDCGSKNVQITRLWYEPMPIRQPGTGKISFAVAAQDDIRGIIKADVKIVRTVSGIKLPVRCYLVDGQQVGSCNYPDLCALLKSIVSYEPGECPANLLQYGIDCNCPVHITKRDLDVEMDVTIPQAPEAASWLSVGDFDVNLVATVGKIVACYDIRFSVKPS